jgi:hypothetical protein
VTSKALESAKAEVNDMDWEALFVGNRGNHTSAVWSTRDITPSQ